MSQNSPHNPTTTAIVLGALTTIWLYCLYNARHRQSAAWIDPPSEHQKASGALQGSPTANGAAGWDLDRVVGLLQLPRAQHDGAADIGAVEAVTSEGTIPVAIHEAPPFVGDDNVTEHDIVPDDEQNAEQDAESPSVQLKELAYAIAKYNTETEHNIHHGVNCNACGQHPLRGIRYKCVNCPDFDFCERCEAAEAHLATHVFFKIKTPLARINFKPIRAWYPGRPTHMPSNPSSATINVVKQKSSHAFRGQKAGLSDDAVRAMYAKFVCLADEPALHDPSMVGRGISFNAFKRLMFLPDRDMKIYRLLFRFFAVDSRNSTKTCDNRTERIVITFSEYVIGNIIVQNNRYCTRDFLGRVFDCLDSNQDGYISRQDVIFTLRASHEFNVACIREELNHAEDAEDAHELMREQDPRTFIEGSGSLGAYFDGGDLPPTFGPNPRAGESKAPDINGDLIPTHTEPGASFLLRGEDAVSQSDAVQRSWISAEQDFLITLHRLASGAKWMAFDRMWRGLSNQHPSYVEVEGQPFVKINTNARTVDEAMFASPNPRLDKDLRERLKQEPKPLRRDAINFVATSIKKRCIEQAVARREKDVRRRQKLGHFNNYNPHLNIGNTPRPDIQQETDSIYNITEEALNTILDDIFTRNREKLNIDEFIEMVRGRPGETPQTSTEQADEAAEIRAAIRQRQSDHPDEEPWDDDEEDLPGAGPIDDDGNPVAREEWSPEEERARRRRRRGTRAAHQVVDWAWGWLSCAVI